ncbi:uncharacterized protein PG986_012219 [Apiospora aurea]|uniref:protein-ribulosamine 3-kinase n=1 Tax=Apiospora aurea TaxID=335848 RepID=A0ABR1PZD7_9PEZI
MSISIQLQLELKEQLGALANSLGGSLPIDQAVLNVLPEGTKSASAKRYGASSWSFTAKIDALDAEEKPVTFFLKASPPDELFYIICTCLLTGIEVCRWRARRCTAQGEYTGMTALHQAAPDLVPRPIAWGKLKTTDAPPSFFILVEFKEFAPGLPDPVKLGARLVAMHRNTQCPHAGFGFHVQTYDGARIRDVTPQEKWTSFFSRLLAESYRQDVEADGVWPELEVVYNRVQSHLIPRLIGTLEEDGRSVTPVLIHGDLWDGNICNDAETGDPWIFDCATYYAHNEMELGLWRAERHQLKAEVYRREYLRYYEASEPKEEWEDRILLYSAKTNFMFSVCVPGGAPSRKVVFDDMLHLIQKYVPWEEDSEFQSQLSQL